MPFSLNSVEMLRHWFDYSLIIDFLLSFAPPNFIFFILIPLRRVALQPELICKGSST